MSESTVAGYLSAGSKMAQASVSFVNKVDYSVTVTDVKNALCSINLSNELLKIFEGISVLHCVCNVRNADGVTTCDGSNYGA